MALDSASATDAIVAAPATTAVQMATTGDMKIATAAAAATEAVATMAVSLLGIGAVRPPGS